ncbi:hypothetical protein, partial [Duncaniella muris]
KMKKLVLLLAVVFSASLFSCGSSDKKAEAADSAVVEEVAVEEVVVADSVAPADSAAAVVDSAAVVAE